jgi:hypothetical protein
MISQKTQMKVDTKSGSHWYQCDPLSPVEEVIEALTTFRTYAIGILKERQEQQKAAAEAPAEQPQG